MNPDWLAYEVSILARTEVRALLGHSGQPLFLGHVSILARTEVRALRDVAPGGRWRELVSILARTEVRALLYAEMEQDGIVEFQSSPAPRCGRCLTDALEAESYTAFQSSPAPRCGRCGCRRPHRRRHDCFNPRPHRGAGAAQAGDEVLVVIGVSILARTEVRALPRRRRCRPGRCRGFNPRPHRGAGAAPKPRRQRWQSATFQSSPAPRCGRCAAALAGG